MGRSLEDLAGLHVLENDQCLLIIKKGGPLRETIKIFNTVAQPVRTTLISSTSSQISKLIFLIIPNQTGLYIIKNQTTHCSSQMESGRSYYTKTILQPQVTVHPLTGIYSSWVQEDYPLWFCLVLLFICVYAMCGICSKSVSSFQKDQIPSWCTIRVLSESAADKILKWNACSKRRQ